MRYVARRLFRYLFPVFFISMGLVFLQKNINGSQAKPAYTQYTVNENIKPENSHVKTLQLVAHNPNNNTHVAIDAVSATKDSEKITFIKPIGSLEKGKSTSSLIASTADYYQNDHQVHFFNKVNFTHNSGLLAKTTYAVLDTQTQFIFGTQGIQAAYQKSKITGDSYQIETQDGKLSVRGNVCLKVNVNKNHVSPNSF